MGQAQDVLKQGLEKLLSANEKHQQAIDKLKQTLDGFKAGLDSQKQAMGSLREALGSSSSPDDAIGSIRDALDSLKDVLDAQKDGMDVAKDATGIVKDGVAQLKDGLDAWSAQQDKSNDDLMIETGKIKEQMIADKTEVQNEIATQVGNVESQVTTLQEMFAKEVLGVDPHDLWTKVADVAKEQLKEYLTEEIRNTIINEVTHDLLPGAIKDAFGSEELKAKIKDALNEDGFLETEVKNVLAKQPASV